MYKLTRMRSLLLALLVTRPSGRLLIVRWLWTLLQCILAGGFVAALVLRTPSSRVFTWQDIHALDGTARGFLMTSYLSLAAGCYLVASAANVVRGLYLGGNAKRLPPSDMAPVLRRAVRTRDPRIAPIAQGEQPVQEAEPGDPNLFMDASSLVVSTPEPLTRPLVIVIVSLAGSIISMLVTIWMVALAVSAIPRQSAIPPFSPDLPDDFFVYTFLWIAGVFVTTSTLIFAFFCRTRNKWKARSRGVEVKATSEGLTIRGPQTHWRPRCIAWRKVRWLARFAYNDLYVRRRVAYILDAGDQTLLWESPPDMRYVSPSSRAKIAQRQASAAQLVALTAAATGLPLLDISGTVNAIARIEPELTASTITVSESLDLIAIDATPTAADVQMLEFLASAGAQAAADDGPVTQRALRYAQLEQCRRLLSGVLVWFATWAAVYWMLSSM